MPRKVIDYSKTIIYKIQHEDDDELLYVGHTTDFTKRKSAHKQGTNNPNNRVYNLKVYKIIRDSGGWDRFRMIEIKKYPCNDANEAEAEEDRIMQEMKANMNERRAHTGLTKYEYNKQYNIDNADKKKECHKKYHIANRDIILEKQRQYTIDNRDKIREKQRQKITCECGCVVSYNALQRHKRSKKHLDLMMLK